MQDVSGGGVVGGGSAMGSWTCWESDVGAGIVGAENHVGADLVYWEPSCVL